MQRPLGSTTKALIALALVAVLAAACGDDGGGTTDGPGNGNANGDAPGNGDDDGEPQRQVGERIESAELEGQPRLALEVVATGLRSPSALTSPPGDDRVFVLERLQGRVRIIEDGVLLDEPFLDVRERLEPTGDEETQEHGLLGLAFHPDYATNGRFFLYHANHSGVGQLVEYRVSDDPNRADPESATVLREYGPARMHHGGALFFGPDGVLWFGIGDGGPGQENVPAQDITDPRGALHRFDVGTPGALSGAAGNPYLGDAEGVDEMWAFGIRNPWRFTLDAETGLLYVADVGQSSVEEVNVVPADTPALDYGWPIFEGTRCRQETCDPAGTVTPVLEVLHEEEDDVCALIGGHVYRGQAIPELQGAYLYSDLCAAFLRSFRYQDGEAVEQLEWFPSLGAVQSMGVDSDGEFYVLDSSTGSVLKLVPAE